MRKLRRLGLAVAAAIGAVVFVVSAAEAPKTPRPSLVVVLSVDQMRADYLERFRPWFADGGLNRFLQKGAVFRQARQRHAATFTGPGHASIGSGLDPRDHGIVSNEWFDPVKGSRVYCTQDPQTRWVGTPAGAADPSDSPASPALTTGVFLGDRLKERFPSARVVGVALKDRAAVLLSGRRADAALWFEEHLGRFMTSSYYPPHPELLEFDARLPAFFAAHREWKRSGLLPADALAAVTFDPPEAPRFEKPSAEMGERFPHPLRNPRAVISSPYGDEIMLDLARFAVERLRLGSRPEIPDLLFVGLCATDFVGHAFGPDSPEIAEHVVRLDRSLDAFFGWLDRTVGNGRVLVFLTSDHGVTPIPELAGLRPRKSPSSAGEGAPADAGRVDLYGPKAGSPVGSGSTARVALEKDLAQKLGYTVDLAAANGTEGAILDFAEPGLSVNRSALAKRGVSIERAKEDVRAFVAALPGVAAVYTNTEIANGLPETALFADPVRRAFRADRSGDVLVYLKPGWIFSAASGKGTTHGQPTEDDRRVPLAAWGVGVRPGVYDDPVSPLAIARTVGAIFGFQAGAPDVAVLEPVAGTADRTRAAAAAVP